MAVKIITDSTSDLSPEEAKALNIGIAPLKVIFGEDEVYSDWEELLPEEFFKKLAGSKKLPTTTQASPDNFERLFRAALEAGDSVVAVTISEKLSGTYQSARIAQDAIGGGEIYIVNSKTTTIAMQILLLLAVRLRDEEKSAKEICETLEEEKKKVRLCAMVDTLEYLQKGGRVSKTAAFAGGILGIKPMIGVEDGAVVSYGKARGAQKGYEFILDKMKKDEKIDFTKPLILGYTGERAKFDPFIAFIKPHLPISDPKVSPIGSVIGTHAGPGASAIAYFLK